MHFRKSMSCAVFIISIQNRGRRMGNANRNKPNRNKVNNVGQLEHLIREIQTAGMEKEKYEE